MGNNVTYRYKADPQELEQDLKKMQREGKKTDKVFDDLNDGMQQGFDNSSKKAGFLNTQFSKLAITLAGLVTAAKLKDLIQDSVELAAKGEAIERAFNRLNNPRILNDLRSATKGTVSDLELMKQAVKASNFQIPLNQLAKLFEFAKVRANETGESVQFLVDSIVTGIGRKSPLILDNLGISAIALKDKLNGASVAAASIGEVAEAVGAIATENLEEIGEVTETTSDKIDKLNARWENMQLLIGRKLTPVIDFLIDRFNAWIELLKDPELELQAERIQKFGESLKELSDDDIEAAIGRITEKIIDQEDKLFRAQRRLNSFLDDRYKFIDAIAAEEKVIESLNKDIAENKELLKVAEQALKTEAETTEKATEKTKDFTKELKALEEQLRKIREQGKANEIDFAEGIKEAEELSKGATGLLADLAAEGRAQAEIDAAAADRLRDQQNEKFFEGIEAKEEAVKGLSILENEQVKAIIENTLRLGDTINRINDTVTQNKIDNLKAELAAGKITDEQFLQEKKRIETESLKISKTVSIIQAIINTSVAVSKALASGSPPLNIILAASVGALGAAEVAAISAQQVPAFAKGTESAPGGLALVGEKGPEYTFIPKGAQVFSNQKTVKHDDIFKAIQKDRLEPHIYEKYVLPELAKQQGLAANILANAPLNDIDLSVVDKAQKKNIRNRDANTKILIQALNSGRRSQKLSERRTY